MLTASPRDDEAQSLEALRSLDVLDSAPEAEFDALVLAASLVCGAPIALISLVDAERQWFKANIGLPGVAETPRDLAFCAHAVRGDGLLEVPDAALDPRFSDNPLVAGAPGIRFYAGAPLRLSDGAHVGTLCVIDRQPRVLTPTQREILGHLATAAVRALEVRRQARVVASSERHFRALSEAAPLGVFATDASGACTYTNDRWQRIFGLNHAQALGDGWTLNIHPEDKASVFSEWRRTATQRLDFDLEFRILHDDGSVHHVRSVSRPVIGVDGTVSGHVGSVEDIDAQVQAGRAAAELLDAVRNQFIVSITDARGTIIEVNDAFCNASEFSRADLLGKDHQVINSRHHAREFFADMWQRIGAGKSWRGEVCNRAKGSSLYWVDSTIVPLRDSDGHIDRFVSIGSEITTRKQLELRLSQLNREQTAMLDSDLVGIVKLRARTSVWTNRGLERIFGYGPGELLNQRSRVLYADDESYLAVGESAYPVLHAGGEFRVQLQMRRKDGALIWIDMSGIQLSEAQGESMWLLADISPLKQAELLRLRAVELEAENRQLQEANRLKGQFISNMSHEMKTPLNAVIGLAGLLQTGVVSPDVPKFKTYLGQIGTSGKELLQLIDAVLDFGQAEAGRIEFKAELVRLPELLGEVVALQRDSATLKQVEVSTDVEAKLVELAIDPMRLKQVLSCYLSNAIKFTAGPGQVTIRARSEGGDRVRIEVQDNGIGIAEVDQPKLFKEFQQLSTGNTKTHQGTGMGLALARKLVEAQGGTVGVRSTLGEGSVFFLTLPCRRGVERVR